MKNNKIYSPVNITGKFSNGGKRYQFVLSNRIFEVSNEGFKSLEKSDVKNKLFELAITAMKSFKFENNKVTWYSSEAVFEYSNKEKKFYANDIALNETLDLDRLLLAGKIKQSEALKLEAFKNIETVLDRIVILDYVELYENDNIKFYVMKNVNQVAVLYENNITGVSEFSIVNDVNNLIKKIQESVNENAAPFLREFLDASMEDTIKIQEHIDICKNNIVFLKDNKEALLNAPQTDKIKKALKLIEAELIKWDNKLHSLTKI